MKKKNSVRLLTERTPLSSTPPSSDHRKATVAGECGGGNGQGWVATMVVTGNGACFDDDDDNNMLYKNITLFLFCVFKRIFN